MKSTLSVRPAGLSFVAGFAIAAGALAQCQPSWDTTPGLPGLGNGYADPILSWNDGQGERLYVGGSFESVGGVGAKFVAKYNPATNGWAQLGNNLSGGFTNGFVTSLVPFTPAGGGGQRLVVGGFYDSAVGVAQTASLAMWNGATWEAMGTTWTGTTRGSIWGMAAWNGRLYVGGGVVNQPPMIAGLPWAGFASWDGQSWQVHTSSVGGFSPYIGEMLVFNDGGGEALFVVGRFDSINGVPGTSRVARFNGTTWSSVGGGVTPTSNTQGMDSLTLFNDGGGTALYVAGYAFIPPGQGVCNVAKWNGQTWTALGGQIGTGRLTSITTFDDGSGNALYIGGTAMPQINQLARWQGGQWQIVDGGLTGTGLPSFPGGQPGGFPSVFGLGVWQDRLYVGGSYTGVNGQNANGFAARVGCAGCYPDCNDDGALTVADFGCFQTRFVAGDMYADCNGDGQLTVADFGCFQTEFVAGCP